VSVVLNRLVPRVLRGDAMIGIAVVLVFVVAIFFGMTWLID
jgi:hypothetical protein